MCAGRQVRIRYTLHGGLLPYAIAVLVFEFISSSSMVVHGLSLLRRRIPRKCALPTFTIISACPRMDAGYAASSFPALGHAGSPAQEARSPSENGRFAVCRHLMSMHVLCTSQVTAMASALCLSPRL